LGYHLPKRSSTNLKKDQSPLTLMFWRLLLVICSLTFLVNGCQILSEEDCDYVDLGGNRRVIEHSCQPYERGSDMSGSTAGLLGVGIGLGMILIAIWPALRNLSENHSNTSRRSNDFYTGSSRAEGGGLRNKDTKPRSVYTSPAKTSSDPGRKEVTCFNCDVLISESANFCPGCGDAAPKFVCPHCETYHHYNALFCSQCGQNRS